jgi:hypothetical protein
MQPLNQTSSSTQRLVRNRNFRPCLLPVFQRVRRPTAFATLQVIATALFAMGAILGCGSKYPETAKVRGTITIEGKPVASGRVMFVPDHGVPAIGEIQPDGSYQLTTFSPGDGAVLGKHRVTIQSLAITNPQSDPKSFEEEVARATKPEAAAPPVPQVEWIIPERYDNESTSGLEAQVAKGMNEINFDVKSK